MLYSGFNQRNDRFLFGTQKGFDVYKCHPCEYLIHHDVPEGVKYIEMLPHDNLYALVKNQEPHKVIIWDKATKKCIGHLSFLSDIKSVKTTPQQVISVIDTKIYIHSLDKLSLVDSIETMNNPRGLCVVSNNVLVCPGMEAGFLRIINYKISLNIQIQAHKTNIVCIALNQTGTRLATASDQGTLIRIFDTQNGKLLHTFRRGSDVAEVYSLAFDSYSKYLICSSSKRTIHIFHITSSDDESKSYFGMISTWIPDCASASWSFVQLHIPESKSIVTFNPSREGSIFIVTDTKVCYTASFTATSFTIETQHILSE